MTVFIGISRKPQFLKFDPGHTSFWCVHRVRDVQTGDLLLLYFPSSTSPSKAGIRQVYRIIIVRRDGDGECDSRGMATVTTELLQNLTVGITIKDMKADEAVRQIGAVGRNMQGVTFKVNDENWPALRSLIIAKNADAADILLEE